MVILDSYVKLPEGIFVVNQSYSKANYIGEITPAVWTEADGSKKFLKSLAGRKKIGSLQSCHMASLNLPNRWVRVHMLSNE